MSLEPVTPSAPLTCPPAHRSGNALNDKYPPFLAWVTWLLIFVVAILSALLITRYAAYVASLLSYPYEWDEDEGLAIYFAQRLAHHEAMYVNFNHLPMLSACYPPVYHLLLAPLVYFMGPTLLAGRLLSLAATLGFCAATAILIQLETRKWPLAVLGTLLVICSLPVAVWSPLARVDSLALALSMGGILALYQARWPRAGMVIGVLLLLLATYTRYQSVLLAPAAFVPLWRRNRRSAFIAMTAFAVVDVLVFWFLNLRSGGLFWISTVLAQSPGYELLRAKEPIRWFVLCHRVLLIGMFVWIVGALWRRELDLWVVLALTVIPLELLLGKPGSSINYHMPCVAIAAICSVLAAQRLIDCSRQGWFSPLGSLLLIALIAQLVLYRMQPLPRPTQEDRRNNDSLVEMIRGADGNILTERRLMLAMAAGREPQIDICTLIFAYDIGRTRTSTSPSSRDAVCWDPTELRQAIQQQRFGLILLEQLTLFPQEIQREIHHFYHVVSPSPVLIHNWHGVNYYDCAVPIHRTDKVNPSGGS